MFVGTLHLPSLFKQLGHLLFLLVPPTFSWNFFKHFNPLLTLFQEYCPPLGLSKGNAIVFHFLAKYCDGILFFSKWLKEYDRILAFIYKVSSRNIPSYSPLNLVLLPSFGSTSASSCASQH